jgi:hypothetical protein
MTPSSATSTRSTLTTTVCRGELVQGQPGPGQIEDSGLHARHGPQGGRCPGARANFLTKDLNVWCNSAEGWFDISVWDKGGKKFDPALLKGRRCFGGLDLASTRDLTAYSRWSFPPDEEGGEWHVLVWFWCPQRRSTPKSTTTLRRTRHGKRRAGSPGQRAT